MLYIYRMHLTSPKEQQQNTHTHHTQNKHKVYKVVIIIGEDYRVGHYKELTQVHTNNKW